jgi:hypothetical protein
MTCRQRTNVRQVLRKSIYQPLRVEVGAGRQTEGLDDHRPERCRVEPALGSVDEHVELDLPDPLKLELLVEGKVGVLPAVGRLGAEQPQHRVEAGRGLDVVAVVAAEHLKLVEVHAAIRHPVLDAFQPRRFRVRWILRVQVLTEDPAQPPRPHEGLGRRGSIHQQHQEQTRDQIPH